MIWYCDNCGTEIKEGEDFYTVESRKMGKDGEIEEFESVLFICKNCLNIA